MTVFHGSNIDFDYPSLVFAKDKRDFGPGFYTTTIKKQAEEWAEDLCERYVTRDAFLYEFEMTLDDLNVKYFSEASKEWLEFILENRTKGGIRHSFDCVKGPVANDRVASTLESYLNGTLSIDEALERLKYIRPNDQLSIHTEAGLHNLVLTRKIKWKL